SALDRRAPRPAEHRHGQDSAFQAARVGAVGFVPNRLTRHGRTCSGHPRLSCRQVRRGWPATSAAMTEMSVNHAGARKTILPMEDRCILTSLKLTSFTP